MAAIVACFHRRSLLLQPGDTEGRVAWAGWRIRGGRGLPGPSCSERNIRVVDGRPAALLRFRAIVLAVVRAFAQALDPLAGECDAIERLAILLPLRLAHRAGGEDEIALDDVALDVSACALAEDSDFVPAGALDPFAAVVAAAETRSDAHAQRGADLLDFAYAADDREFRDRVHVFNPSFSLPLGLRLMPSVPRGAAHEKPGEPRQHPRGTSGPERQAEDGGGRRFCRARNSAMRPKGKIVERSRCGVDRLAQSRQLTEGRTALSAYPHASLSLHFLSVSCFFSTSCVARAANPR